MAEQDPPSPPPIDEEDRDAILARRALFIASAVAGIGLASCDGPGPFACLEVAPVDGGAAPAGSSAPLPCLTTGPPQPEPPDAGASIEVRDGGQRDAAAPKDATGPRDAAAPSPRDAAAPPPHACLMPKVAK